MQPAYDASVPPVHMEMGYKITVLWNPNFDMADSVRKLLDEISRQRIKTQQTKLHQIHIHVKVGYQHR